MQFCETVFRSCRSFHPHVNGPSSSVHLFRRYVSTTSPKPKAKASPSKAIKRTNALDDVSPTPSSRKNLKNASEQYTKLSQLEHILKRPDTYIGSVETISQPMWTYDSASSRMIQKPMSFVPGFYKIVDEILVNAADNKVNDPTMDTIKIDIDVEAGEISVFNNGRGIPIEIHDKEGIYIPELIFGNLLSGSNYDDAERRLTGGRNGFGAKLANIYSTQFTIETAHKESQQKYKQTWSSNMTVCSKPKITKNTKGDEWTRVTFTPDFARFGMTNIDADSHGLLMKRAHDLAGTIRDVKVFLNGERLKVKNFKSYVEMYLASAATTFTGDSGAASTKPSVIHEIIDDRWEVAFAMSDGSFEQVSFANSISTSKGGTHVNHVVEQIAKHLVGAVTKKNKAATVKPAQIKNHMWIFVNALIENPTFDNQTKETLTLTASKWGSKPAVSEEFLKKVQKSPIIDQILNWAKFKADQEIKKTDGSKRTRLIGLTKLSDANLAATKHGQDCTLILTEGESAKALAIAGLAVVGRDNFGVFPLRGKLLNVREAKHDQILKNEEIQSIRQIMGLQHNKEYMSTQDLRYGKIMIMTDQDHDGSHIKGLLINFFDHFYPSLLKLPGFLVEFVTPIVRVTLRNTSINFYTIPEYEQWAKTTVDQQRWSVKYYKGLGTSSDSDARQYFSNMGKHVIPFATTQEGDRELIDLAFSKKKADERKEWLRSFKPGTHLDHDMDEIPYSDFINKELILFSMADNIRSIPSVADGLKPGQRKIIWACFKRNMKKEMKVAQLVGYVAEQAAYHHGEVSLMQTIIGLAQDYVGSNNINLLMPNGQYGTRAEGGKDHAAARYIFTELAPLARSIFHEDDDKLLKPQTEDNELVEPEWYLPVVPMILINGAEGIGTGWSTSIPCYNPVDIVSNIRRLMHGQEQEPMLPWWQGFRGEIREVEKHKFEVTGVAEKTGPTSVGVTELPIHKWTQNFKNDLESMVTGEKSGRASIKDYREYHDNTNVHFAIQMNESQMERAEEVGLGDYFKLTSRFSTSNMMAFDFNGQIKKYGSPMQIIEEFYPVRLEYYQRRKKHLATEIQAILDRLSNQARFIQLIVDDELIVSNRQRDDIVEELRERGFKSSKDLVEGDTTGLEEERGEAFDYLLGMSLWTLTSERIQRLKKQANERKTELNALMKRTPQNLWNSDLDAFLVEWEQACVSWEKKKMKGGGGDSKKRGRPKKNA